MKTFSFGALVLTAGITGLLSFGFLAAAIGSEYWYIIKVNQTDVGDFDSHSGLWRIHEDMHSMIVVLLPLSLVLLVLGGICGLVSSLARSPVLLTGAASYFLVCSLLTLSGVSLYISYSQAAVDETERLVGAERLAQVCTSYGWSLGLAWLSCGLEVLTGLLLLLAARTARRQHGHQGHHTVA
ncbi:transmembrane protein 235 isoform X2 [Hypomesus transpacificus]|uniref:transmembrane protein 235 isoform X2 n=1 Tax=Hypomesus transpacificus TaxID=137520 RepID=UPI001F086A81|nr:transmembrane protein 235 isoform X2 [Hypomesus transpacificus]